MNLNEIQDMKVCVLKSRNTRKKKSKAPEYGCTPNASRVFGTVISTVLNCRINLKLFGSHASGLDSPG